MTWEELVDGAQSVMILPRNWKKRRVPRHVAVTVLTATFKAIRDEVLKNGERVAVPGFGVFVAKQRKARRVRVPNSEEYVALPSQTRLGFRASTKAKHWNETTKTKGKK